MIKKILKNATIYVLSDFLIKSSSILLTPYLLIRLNIIEFGQFGLITATMALGQLGYNLGFQSGYVRFYYIKEFIHQYISSSTVF